MKKLFCIVFSLFVLFSSEVIALTIISDGTDGSFIPTTSTTLLPPVDGIFNFTDIDIASGVTLDFNRNGYEDTIWLTSTSNISIFGDINWTGTLGISAPGDVAIGGNFVVANNGNLTIESNGLISFLSDSEINVSDTLALRGGNLRSSTTDRLPAELTISNGSNTGNVVVTPVGSGSTINLNSVGSIGGISIGGIDGGPGEIQVVSEINTANSITLSATGGINGNNGEPITLDGVINLTTTGGSDSGGGVTLTVVPIPLPFVLFLSSLFVLASRVGFVKA